MKIIVNKNYFEKKLNNINKIVDFKPPHLKSLEGIKIIADKNQITLISSNGNLSVKEVIDVDQKNIQVIQPGKALIHGKIFFQIFQKQNEKVEISIEDNISFINSLNFISKINLLELDEFPEINFDLMGQGFEVKTEELKKIIKNVSFAASNEIRDSIVFNGVNFNAIDGELTLTATNRFRIAQDRIKIENDIKFNTTVLARDLKHFLNANIKDEKVQLTLDNDKMLIKWGTTNFLIKLIDDIYPEINKFIPEKFNFNLKINNALLLNLLDKSISLNSENSQSTTFFELVNNELTINVNKNQIGSVFVKTNEIKWEGDEFKIGFNSTFLKEAINKFENHHELEIGFNDRESIFIIKEKNTPNLLQLILPHRF